MTHLTSPDAAWRTHNEWSPQPDRCRVQTLRRAGLDGVTSSHPPSAAQSPQASRNPAAGQGIPAQALVNPPIWEVCGVRRGSGRRLADRGVDTAPAEAPSGPDRALPSRRRVRSGVTCSRAPRTRSASAPTTGAPFLQPAARGRDRSGWGSIARQAKAWKSYRCAIRANRPDRRGASFLPGAPHLQGGGARGRTRQSGGRGLTGHRARVGVDRDPGAASIELSSVLHGSRRMSTATANACWCGASVRSRARSRTCARRRRCRAAGPVGQCGSLGPAGAVACRQVQRVRVYAAWALRAVAVITGSGGGRRWPRAGRIPAATGLVPTPAP